MVPSRQGTRIDCITSEFELEQLVYKTIHIIEEMSSCIDLIFAFLLLNQIWS